MKYLSHSTQRNISWTAHANFPKRAVKNRDADYARSVKQNWPDPERFKSCLTIYRFSEDGKTITLVPEEEWEV